MKLTAKLLLAVFLMAFCTASLTAQKVEAPRREGHGYGLYSAAFSPDSRYLATADAAGTIVVWDIAAAKALFRIDDTDSEGFAEPVFSPDGKILAAIVKYHGDPTVLLAETIRFWDARSGKPLPSPDGEFRGIEELTFSPDSKMLVAETELRNTIVWDLVTLKPKALSFKGSGPYAFDPEGKRMAFAMNERKSLAVADAATGRVLRTIPGFGFVVHTAFDPLGKVIAVSDETEDPKTGESEVKLKAFDAATGRRIPGFGPVDTHPPIGFAEDGKSLIALQFEQNFAEEPGETTTLGAFFDTLTGKKRKDLVVDFPVNAFGMAFSRDGSLLAIRASSSIANTLGESEVLVIDTRSGKEHAKLRGYRRAVNSLAFTTDGKELVTTHPDSTILRWDTGRWAPISMMRLERFEGDDVQLKILPDRRTFTFLNETTMFDLSTGEPRQQETGDKNWVAVSGDGRVMAASSMAEEKLAIYKLPGITVRNELPLPVPAEELSSLAFALDTDGSRLAYVKDSELSVTDAHSGKILSKLQLPKGQAGPILFSPDGRRIAFALSEAASTTSRWTLTVVDASTGKRMLSLPRDNEYFIFTADSGSIISLQESDRLIAVSIDTGKPTVTSKVRARRMSDPLAFALHPTRPIVAVGTEFGVQVFDLRSGEQLSRLR